MSLKGGIRIEGGEAEAEDDGEEEDEEGGEEAQHVEAKEKANDKIKGGKTKGKASRFEMSSSSSEEEDD